VDQQREVAQLYAGTNTLTSEIRKPFGISEASVYRIVQRQGVPLRGRGGSPTPGQAPAPATQPRALAATVPTPPAGARRRGRAAVRRTKPSASRRTASGGAGARRQFRIQFHGERVIQALHIRDALRQAELLGAIEITEIAQAD
jgi:hypothetical protein